MTMWPIWSCFSLHETCTIHCPLTVLGSLWRNRMMDRPSLVGLLKIISQKDLTLDHGRPQSGARGALSLPGFCVSILFYSHLYSSVHFRESWGNPGHFFNF